MGRLSKEDYRRAKKCLKRYNYNCINIINRQSDILSLSVAPHDRVTTCTIRGWKCNIK